MPSTNKAAIEAAIRKAERDMQRLIADAERKAKQQVERELRRIRAGLR